MLRQALRTRQLGELQKDEMGVGEFRMGHMLLIAGLI